MKKNMLHLLSALAIASMLCGSLEVNAMRTGYWNRTGNAARTGLNQTKNWWAASRSYRVAGTVGVMGYGIGQHRGWSKGYNERQEQAEESAKSLLAEKQRQLQAAKSHLEEANEARRKILKDKQDRQDRKDNNLYVDTLSFMGESLSRINYKNAQEDYDLAKRDYKNAKKDYDKIVNHKR